MRAPAQHPAEDRRGRSARWRRRSSRCWTAGTWAGSTSGCPTRACRTSWRSTRCRRWSRAPASTPRRSWRACTSTAVIDSVIRARPSATRSRTRARRQGKPTRKTGPLRVGFTYNVKRDQAHGGRRPRTARPSTTRPTTLQAIREAIASWGHEVVDLEANAGAARRARQHAAWTSSSTSPRASRAATARARCRRCWSCWTSRTPARIRPRCRIALDKALAKKIVRQRGHPHAQLPADDHRQGAAQQGVHQLPADREAGGGGLLQGRRLQERLQHRGGAARGGARRWSASTSSRR